MAGRTKLVQLLAEVSHETWMRQKERDQGIPRDQLDPEVSDHDLERAKDAVAALEERGVFSPSGLDRHWHKEPAASTYPFIESVPFMPTPKGLKAVLEVTAYREGAKIAVGPASVEGPNKNRTIRQAVSLMFNDANEAKDAIDAIVDRLETEAKRR